MLNFRFCFTKLAGSVIKNPAEIDSRIRLESEVNEMQRRVSPQRYWRLRLNNARNAKRVRSALGRSLQRYVFDILKSAIKAGAPIKEVKEARPFSPADRKGWDIVVVDNEGGWHPLQVKSSNIGALEFRRRGTEKGLFVAVIVPRLNDAPQEILDNIGEVMPLLRGFKLEKEKGQLQ